MLFISAITALFIGSAAAAVAGPSTVTSTAIATITSCGPQVTDCPLTKSSATSTAVTTSTVSVKSSSSSTPMSSVPVKSSSSSTPMSSVPVKSSSTPVAPVTPKTTSTPVPSSSSPVKPVTLSSSVPYCATYTEACTVTVTLPSSSSKPTSFATGVSSSSRRASGTGGAAPYPSGTPTYYLSTTGSVVKPTSPAQFMGAASHVKGGLLAAGAGAVAALLL